jgi:hypothetical protein
MVHLVLLRSDLVLAFLCVAVFVLPFQCKNTLISSIVCRERKKEGKSDINKGSKQEMRKIGSESHSARAGKMISTERREVKRSATQRKEAIGKGGTETERITKRERGQGFILSEERIENKSTATQY